MERENRNHGNQEKGKEEKEALREVTAKQQTGDAEASPKFFCTAPLVILSEEMRFACESHYAVEGPLPAG